MNEIDGIQPAGAAHSIQPPDSILPTSLQPEPIEAGDVVEISEVARLAARIQDIPDIRAELVARVRAEIAAGVYETPDRLEIAVERLTEELLGDL